MENNVATLPTARAEADDSRDLLTEVIEIQADSRLSQKAISKEIGISDTALSQWRNGIYPVKDLRKIESQIARWVDSYRERALSARSLPEAPAWVQTPSADRVLAALGYAQIAGDIAVVYGGAGLGKTTAIRQYQRTAPNVWHATMTPATATVVPALEEVADALGIKEITGGAARIQRAIVRRLLGTQGLLVIDEAQHLGVAALDAMRALHDATNVGLALVGNEAVYARMTGGNRAAYLDRLYSRIGKRVRLTRSTQADVTAVIAAWNINAKECRQVLHEIASKPGGLRGLTKVLRLASMFAVGAQREVNCDDIRHAWRDLGGE